MNNFLTHKMPLLVLLIAFAMGSARAQLQVNLDLQKPTCNGYTNGQATAYVSGGQEPYSYQWSTGTSSVNTVWGLTGGDYSLTVTDANGLSQVVSFTLDQPDPLQADIIHAGDPCTSTTYAAYVTGGTPGYSYQWNTGETTSSIQNPSTDYLFLTVTDVFGCQTTAASPVTAPLQVNLQMSDITCNNYNDGVATVTATGGQLPYQYYWSTGEQDATYISGLAEGTYSVTVVDANGCSATASGSVANPPATEVTIIKDPECGVPTTITVITQGGVGPHMFMWGDGGDGMAPDSIYTNFQGGTVYLCVLNANHCPHDVWVTASPGFDLNANVTDADCNGNGGSIDLMPSTVIAPVTYHWEGPNGFTADTEDLSNLAPGTYSVTATDLGGCTATYSATVGQMQAANVDFDASLLNCDNNVLSIQFSAYPNDPNATYSWSFSGNQQQEVAQFTSNPGQVTLNVDFGNGCTSSITKPVDFDIIDVSLPGAQQACLGDDLQINLQNNNNTPVDYVWTPADLILSGANTPNPVINTSAAGSHQLEVQMTNANGCSVTQTIPVEIMDPAAFAVNTDNISYKQCQGQVIDFQDANSNLDNYHWEFPDGSTASGADVSFDFAALGQGTYEVMLVPNDATCANPVPYEVTVGEPAVADFKVDYIGCVDSIAFTDLSTAPAPITGWTWEFPTEFKEQNPTIPADIVNFQDFDAKLTIEFGDGCVLSIEKPVQVDPIDVNLPPQLTICDEGGSVQLNPNGNTDYIYTWSPAAGLDDPNSPNPTAHPNSNQTYSVQIVNPNNTECIVEESVDVVVAPVALVATGDTTVCDNLTEVPVSADYSGGDFAWYDDPSLTNPISTDPDLNLAAGTYYAVVTNAEGCMKVDTVTVLADPATIDIVQSQLSICAGEDVALEVQPANLNPDWYLNDVLIGTGNPLIINPSESGMYVAKVTNGHGCTAIDSVQVDVIDLNVDLAATEVSIYLSQSTELSATEGFESYQWSPPEGLDDPNSPNPTATPTETTTYTVTVTDANGCTAEQSITIEVKDTECGEPFIYLPNAFTPDGDGKNDVLYLRGLNLTDIYLAIYNRWGQMVFETRDQSIGWDGTFKGEPVVPDVYGYYLRVKCSNGEEYFKKGNVSVLK